MFTFSFQKGKISNNLIYLFVKILVKLNVYSKKNSNNINAIDSRRE